MKENGTRKIAFHIGSLAKGGAERVLVNLAEYFLSAGYDVLIVTQYICDDEYPISDGIKRVICEIDETKQKGRVHNFILRFHKLRTIWKTEKPDIILSFIGKNNLMAVLTSRFLTISVAVSVRAEPRLEYYTRLLRFMARTCFHMADGVILQTEACRDFFPKSLQSKIVIMKNSLNPVFLCEPYKGKREKQIVAVGRIDQNKNHKMIIQAFKEVYIKHPGYELIIYGEGQLRQELILLVEQLGLTKQIQLPGAIDQVKDAIFKSSMFILSSDSEGQPNTLLEAMALGLPCISTDCPCGGPAALITNQENGILIPIQDTGALTKAMNQIIENPDFAAKLGENAARIQQTFSPEMVNAGWRQYLEKLMK